MSPERRVPKTIEVDAKSAATIFPPCPTREKVRPAILHYFDRMNKLMQKEHVFKNPDLTIQQLAKMLETNKAMMVKVLQFAGFTSFREYVNLIRVNYFKYQVVNNPAISITSLITACGFTSRAVFYRYFSHYEGMTPSQYLEKADMLDY